MLSNYIVEQSWLRLEYPDVYLEVQHPLLVLQF